MIAASFWSLLAPSISYVEMQNETGATDMPNWFAPAVGVFLGALFLYCLDKIIPHLHINFKRSEAEGIETNWRKTILLVLAITLHNIPEGLAVGVAFGAIAHGIPGFEIGIGQMAVQERALVIMPSYLAYRESAQVIPPFLTNEMVDLEIIPTYASKVGPYKPLIFEIQLIGVN